MTDTFLIHDTSDSNPANWYSVSTLLSSVSSDVTVARSLEWEYQPYAKFVKLGNGKTKGRGYPIIRWTFKALRPEQRENLRDFCTGLSSDVYIHSPTNETVAGVRVWDDFLCIMNWMTRSELVGTDWVEMIELTFTHCVAV